MVTPDTRPTDEIDTFVEVWGVVWGVFVAEGRIGVWRELDLLEKMRGFWLGRGGDGKNWGVFDILQGTFLFDS